MSTTALLVSHVRSCWGVQARGTIPFGRGAGGPGRANLTPVVARGASDVRHTGELDTITATPGAGFKALPESDTVTAALGTDSGTAMP